MAFWVYSSPDPLSFSDLDEVFAFTGTSLVLTLSSVRGQGTALDKGTRGMEMGGSMSQNNGSRGGICSLLAAYVAATAGIVCPVASHGADVYASTSADGSIRYATQPLDPSYTLLFTDTAGSTAALPVSRKVRHAAGAQQLRLLISESARRHDLPVSLVQAIVAIESGFNAGAVSQKGARGAMQLMPATARRYGLLELRQLESPRENIDAGVRHLKELLARHHGNVALALAAYNAGSGAVQRHGNRIPPFPETMLYVPAVLGRAAADQL